MPEYPTTHHIEETKVRRSNYTSTYLPKISNWSPLNLLPMAPNLQGIASARREVHHGIAEGATTTAATAEPQLTTGAHGLGIA